MKKQTALVLSTLVLLSAVSVQPAHAFKFGHKKAAEPVVVAPVKKEVAPIVETPVSVVKEDVKKVETTVKCDVKKVEKDVKKDVKKVKNGVKKEVKKVKAKATCPCKKPAVKPVAKAPVKK